MFEFWTQPSPQATPEIKVPMRQREFRPGDVVIDILCAGGAPCLCAGGAPCVPVGHLHLGHSKLFIELVPLRHSE